MNLLMLEEMMKQAWKVTGTFHKIDPMRHSLSNRVGVYLNENGMFVCHVEGHNSNPCEHIEDAVRDAFAWLGEESQRLLSHSEETAAVVTQRVEALRECADACDLLVATSVAAKAVADAHTTQREETSDERERCGQSTET